MCAVILVACERTHRTTFRVLRVTFQVATQGAESAVYGCFVVVNVNSTYTVYAMRHETVHLPALHSTSGC